MLKPTNLNPFWIGYYFGQNCIIHPDTGRWILTGYFDGQVMVKKNIGTPEEDCMSYPIAEVQFIFKQINPTLFKDFSRLFLFRKLKAMDGYWVFNDSNVNVILES